MDDTDTELQYLKFNNKTEKEKRKLLFIENRAKTIYDLMGLQAVTQLFG
jgi:hypothetical protein